MSTLSTSIELEVEIEYDYDSGSPGYTSGLPENCYPTEDESVEIQSVMLGNIDITQYLRDNNLLDSIEESCLEDGREEQQSHAEDMAKARAEARAEREAEEECDARYPEG